MRRITQYELKRSYAAESEISSSGASMSHSKRRARGQSYHLDVVNGSGNEYVRTCSACGTQGFDPDAVKREPNQHLIAELRHRYGPLPLNGAGHCKVCAAQLSKAFGPMSPADVAIMAKGEMCSDSELAETFQELARKWRERTGHLSDMGRAAEHPFHRAIVAMGPRVVPLMLNDFKGDNPGFWFMALAEITGENPIEDADRGMIQRMEAAWLEWGAKHGYVV